MVEETHFGDPPLPECWPLLSCISRLPASPARGSAWAHFWPLARNANKSDLAREAPGSDPGVSFTDPTWVLSPPAFSGSFRYLRCSQCVPHPIILVLAPTPFHLSSTCSFKKGIRRQGWEIVASLGHNGMTPTCLTGEQRSWRCKTENLCHTARTFFFSFSHTLMEIYEKAVEKKKSTMWIQIHCSVYRLLLDFIGLFFLQNFTSNIKNVK